MTKKQDKQAKERSQYAKRREAKPATSASNFDIPKLMKDVERELGPRLLFGCPYDRGTIDVNIAGVRKDARKGKIAMPETHSEWVAALVAEYKANVGAVGSVMGDSDVAVELHENGFTIRRTSRRAG